MSDRLSDEQREALAGVLYRSREPLPSTDDDRTLEEFYADTLAPLVAQMLADARAEALREAAEAWVHCEWSDVMLPKPTPPAVPVIAYSNRMGDWLRDRAEESDRD